MASLWFIQFRAFIWKIFIQQLRAPVSTTLEFFLPCFFILILTLGYLYSDTRTFTFSNYGGVEPVNMSNMFTSMFCQNATHPRPFGTDLPLPTCVHEGEDLLCTPLIRQGALCMRDRYELAYLWSVAHSAEVPVVLPTLDVYLTFSAFITHEAKIDNLGIFVPPSVKSFTHYGHLLIVAADGNKSVGMDFVKFCTEVSVLCGEVVYTDRIFTSMKDAQKFAMEKSGEVWAIVELPSSFSSSTGGKANDADEAKIFTISMNYSATPLTFDPKTSFSSPLGAKQQLLYINSGFLTLQNLVQQFYLRQRLKLVTASSSSGVKPQDIFEYVHLSGPSLYSMPFLRYTQSDFYRMWSYFMPLVSVLTAVLPVTRLVSWIVEEKSLRIRESMQIMGLRWSCMALGWYLSALLLHFVSACLVTVIMKFSFFRSVSYGVIFCLYFSFVHQNISLALFLSTFFTNPRIAGIVAAMCVFVCSVPFYFFPEGMGQVRLIALCFAPCVAYAKSFQTLAMYVSFGRAFNWEDMFHGEFTVALAIGLMWASSGIMLLLAMYFDQVFPSSIGRRRSPLFFLSSLRNLSCCRPGDSNTKLKENPLSESKPCGEDGLGDCNLVSSPKKNEFFDSSNQPYAAVFCNLNKEYDNGGVIGWFYYFITGLRRDGDYCEAVRNVSFKLEFGKINMLVGKNGSGKSTIMGMATGMVEPTSGEVYICGHDAKTNLGRCRKHIGYCPQSDILWGSLTVEEHLFFYARMKRVANGRWNVKEQVDKVITNTGLEDKRGTVAKRLSSGQRRCLCIGIALIGDPDVLFLDEPTAGLDIKGRKAVYSVLKQDSKKRAVLMTTNVLDDADRLGDRVLLMQDGVLCCTGQPLFLKSMVGVGYVLTCVVDACASEIEENMLISKVTGFVRARTCPGHSAAITANGEGDNTEGPRPVSSRCKLLGVERRGREISFRFPISLLSSTNNNLICQLEEQREQLRLCSIGLSFTRLHDVVDAVTNPSRRQRIQEVSSLALEGAFDNCGGNTDNGGRVNVEEGISIEMENYDVAGATCSFAANSESANMGRENSALDVRSSHENNAPSFKKHFSVLFMKRLLCAKRDFRFLFFQIVLPLFFLSVAFLTDYIHPEAQPPLVLDASIYSGYNKKPYASVAWAASSVLHDSFGVNGADMSAAFGSYYTPVRVTCDSEKCLFPLFKAIDDNLNNHINDFIFAFSLTGTRGANPTSGSTSALIYNTSYHHSAPQGLNALYNLVNQQIFGKGSTVTARNQPMEMGYFERKTVNYFTFLLFGFLVMLPFTFIPSNIIGYIVRENQSGSRHLQWLAGANIWAFWLSSMLFDFCSYLVTELFALLVFLLFKRWEFIGSFQAIGATLSLFSMFGLSTIAFSYVLCFFIRSPFIAQGVVLIANFVFGFLWIMSEQMLGGIPLFDGLVRYAAYILRLIPAASFCEGVFVLSYLNVGILSNPGLIKPDLFSFLSVRGGVFIGGIGTGLVYMFSTFILSLLLLGAFEYTRLRRFSRPFTRLFSCRSSRKKNDKDAGSRDHCASSSYDVTIAGGCDSNDCGADESVVREETEVCADATGREEDYITLQHITKKYAGADKAAVDDLSLGVHKGEVMVLLGLNGSGKSTTIAILAGDVLPTSGSGYINYLPISSLASRRYLGYCPQKEGLIDHLSPYEHLCLYAALRGTKDTCIRNEVEQLLDVVGLAGFRNTPAYALSGGNKRRLSLAIAFVGGTNGVLLDEPTAGMDIIAQRQTCALIKRLMRHRSVLLTTHMADETEALADRVAFISKGKLRCIGTQQEVKARFTNDAVYTVCVVFTTENMASGTLDSDLTNRLCECFGAHDGVEGKQCVLESVVGNVVTLSVQQSLSQICTVTAALREGTVVGLPPVAQVCATQPTLEDILLRL